MRRLALVTGTSTGIGRAIAVDLAARGFEVLAGVRQPDDAPPGCEPILLDVTSPGTRYVVGREARAQALLARLLPDRALDVLVQRALKERAESPAG